MRSEGGVTAMRADYVIQARGATDEEAIHLDLPAGAPVLQGWHLSVDATGRPLESGRVVYRGDRYRFRTTLRHAVQARSGEERVTSV
jgi:DNA-binding GntR family transcriptional regulator